MFFYYWNNVYVTFTASEVQKYRCERCGDAYCFEAVATATGKGHSPFMLDDEEAARRAQRRARSRARRVVRTWHYPVPCPSCGWYQRAMLNGMRRRLYTWMRTVAVVAVLLAAPAFLAGAAAGAAARTGRAADPLVGGACAGLCLLVGLVFFIGLVIRRRRFDPNQRTPAATRIALGRDMAVSVTDLPYPLPRITPAGRIIDPPDPGDELR